MRKVHLPRMRRHVGTFGHEAHIAKRAGFGDLGEILGLYAFDIFGRIVVDQIEEARKGIAKIEAAATAMTNIEDPAHLRVQFYRIGEVGTVPVDDMARRGAETAFVRGHG